MDAYAVDLLFFLTQLHTSIPNLLQAFTIYECISNLKIIHTKSEAMNLPLPSNIVLWEQQNNSFKWVPSALKYLGVWLTQTLSNIFTQKFKPILCQIEPFPSGCLNIFSGSAEPPLLK